MEIRQVSKKRYKEILRIVEALGLSHDLPKTKNIKMVTLKRSELLLVDDEPVLVHVEGIFIPYLDALNRFSGYGVVTVDKGAVKYIANGADVMRPGIVSYTTFKAGDIVVVRVEEYGNPIAVGKALVDSEALSSMERGKVVENLHHIGDEAWNTAKNIGN